MKSLGKDEKTQRVVLLDRLQAAAIELLAAEMEFNNTLKELFVPLQQAADHYNGVCQDVKEFTEGCSQTIADYISGMSDKWKEGEAGQRYIEWQLRFEQWEFNDITPEATPINIDVPEPEEDFGNLPMSISDV